jgi:hypothetical protein
MGGGRGRGLVLTTDAAAGEILLVCNPVAMVSKAETKIAEGPGATVLRTGCWTGSHEVLADQLVALLCAKAFRSCRIRKLLSTLCPGSAGGGQTDRLPLPVPSIDLMVQQGSDPSKRDDHGDGAAKQDDEGFKQEVPGMLMSLQEMERICRVVQCNAFGYTRVQRKSKKEMSRCWSCGIWMLPSFLNHSCTPNVASVIVGDAMMIVASRRLKSNEELTVSYFDIFRPLKERRCSMLKSWSFICCCKRCQVEGSLQESLNFLSEAYSFQETEAAHTLQARHMGCPADDTWNVSSVVNLAVLPEILEKVLLREPGLSRDESNWIRASFISGYLADGQRLMTDPDHLKEERYKKPVKRSYLEIALDAAETVSPGHPQTLQIAAVFQDRAIHMYGKNSLLVKRVSKRAMRICLRLFGKQTDEILKKLVIAATLDVLSSCVMFSNQQI